MRFTSALNAAFIATVTNYVGVPQSDITSLRAASPAWVVDKTVAPLYFVDSQDDLMPADQVDDLAAQLNAVACATTPPLR